MSSSDKTSWDANLYNSQHDFVSKYGMDLISLLNPQKEEYILDLGCGTGTLTYEISKSGARVLGIDSSSEMIQQARNSYNNLVFEVADGHNLQFTSVFNAVFSNAALHWMTEPSKVIAGVWRALKNGGRFVLEMGGINNIKKLLDTIAQVAAEFNISCEPLLNYYPSIAGYASLLEAGQFRVTYCALLERPTPLKGPEGLRNWVRMFRNAVLEQLSQSQQELFLQRLETIAKPFLYHNHTWWADYVRLRVMAIKNM
jgi:trans-aconitate methyltransferase